MITNYSVKILVRQTDMLCSPILFLVCKRKKRVHAQQTQIASRVNNTDQAWCNSNGSLLPRTRVRIWRGKHISTYVFILQVLKRSRPMYTSRERSIGLERHHSDEIAEYMPADD